jgi:hypothetical protein
MEPLQAIDVDAVGHNENLEFETASPLAFADAIAVQDRADYALEACRRTAITYASETAPTRKFGLPDADSPWCLPYESLGWGGHTPIFQGNKTLWASGSTE